TVKHDIIRPYALAGNVAIFKELQELQKVGIVAPVGEQYMYFAAMHSKSCKLTPLGRHFWEVAKKGLI
ncbi:MAG: caspase family protein, partial [Kiritimatiellae bacterium]|nr:caspase family protein [Kiritimatiellia bacterium]